MNLTPLRFSRSAIVFATIRAIGERQVLLQQTNSTDRSIIEAPQHSPDQARDCLPKTTQLIAPIRGSRSHDQRRQLTPRVAVIDLQADAWDELGRQFLLLRVRTGHRTPGGQMLLSLFVWDGRTAQSGRFPPFGQLVQLPGYHLAGMAGVLAGRPRGRA
jgi:hypothetical protein